MQEVQELEANRSVWWSSAASCRAVRSLLGNGAERGGQSDPELEPEEEGRRAWGRGGFFVVDLVREGASSTQSEERFLGSPSFMSRAVEGSRFLSSLLCSNKFFSLLGWLDFLGLVRVGFVELSGFLVNWERRWGAWACGCDSCVTLRRGMGIGQG